MKTLLTSIGRSGFIGVGPWSKEIASLAAKNQMIRDEAAEKFYQQGPSNTGSNESVSDLEERPSAVSTSSNYSQSQSVILTSNPSTRYRRL